MKKLESSQVVIVMPAYNAERTIKDTFFEIPKSLRKKIILVDDKSLDNTVAISQKLGIHTIIHKKNLGYGGNQKTCYKEALKHKPDVVVMLHPDYQYDAKRIPALIKPILNGQYDFMFGSRMSTRNEALKGGMPLIKYYINRLFCKLENMLLGVSFTEHFSGLRAYSTKLLQTVPLKEFSNDFVFDQEMTISALSFGLRIGEIPIPTRYHEKSSSIRFKKGAKFLIQTGWTMLIFKLHLWKIKQSKLFSRH